MQRENHRASGNRLTPTERKARVISVWDKAKADLAKLVAKVLPADNAVYQMVDSGSRGSWSQPIHSVRPSPVMLDAVNEADHALLTL